ncbi:hypothetical protein Tco_0148458, partial [Tanacetum coccineum]
MPVDQLMEEFDMVIAQHATLVAQLRARFSSESSQSIQKDKEILLLKAQLADAQAEAESLRSPKDSKLLGKLKEAGDAACQVGSSEQ